MNISDWFGIVIAFILGAGIGASAISLFYKKTDGVVNPDIKSHLATLENAFQKQIDELKSKLLPDETPEVIKNIEDKLWETLRTKIIDEFGSLKVNAETHLQQIETAIAKYEQLGKEELIKLHLLDEPAQGDLDVKEPLSPEPETKPVLELEKVAETLNPSSDQPKPEEPKTV